jgi:hypothetical protein
VADEKAPGPAITPNFLHITLVQPGMPTRAVDSSILMRGAAIKNPEHTNPPSVCAFLALLTSRALMD